MIHVLGMEIVDRHVLGGGGGQQLGAISQNWEGIGTKKGIIIISIKTLKTLESRVLFVILRTINDLVIMSALFAVIIRSIAPVTFSSMNDRVVNKKPHHQIFTSRTNLG